MSVERLQARKRILVDPSCVLLVSHTTVCNDCRSYKILRSDIRVVSIQLEGTICGLVYAEMLIHMHMPTLQCNAGACNESIVPMVMRLGLEWTTYIHDRATCKYYAAYSTAVGSTGRALWC